MATTYGQSPHFDISSPFFDDGNPLYNIQYGLSVGHSRKKIAIRKYVFNYINNTFVFYKTYDGIKQNQTRINKVNDVEDINLRSSMYYVEKIGEVPSFITQSFLNSIFLNPSQNNIFFIEGIISKITSPPSRPGRYLLSLPNLFSLYRYGKIINDKIIICKENISTKTH